MDRVAVLGAGAWGQALALLLSRAGHAVTLHGRRPDAVHDGERRSHRLHGVALPDRLVLRPLADPPGAADLVLVAVPVAALRAVLATVGSGASSPLVLCAKGMAADTGSLPSEIAAEACPGRPVALLSGPNFAGEIARFLPAAAVLAASDLALARSLAAAIGTERFRLYPSDDPVGVGVCGAAKNVVAIAAGVAIGAALGENARAALVSRGLAETARLAEALGGRPDTVAGLAGIGDLVLTATGGASRNFRTGVALGRGEPHAPIGADEVVEGVATAAPLLRRGTALGVDLPITQAVADLLAGRVTVQGAMAELLARKARGVAP